MYDMRLKTWGQLSVFSFRGVGSNLVGDVEKHRFLLETYTWAATAPQHYKTVFLNTTQLKRNQEN